MNQTSEESVIMIDLLQSQTNNTQKDNFETNATLTEEIYSNIRSGNFPYVIQLLEEMLLNG